MTDYMDRMANCPHCGKERWAGELHICKEEIPTNLTFDLLRQANIKRSEEKVFPSQNWTLAQWACAMAGEAGEACNVVKKTFRGDEIAKDALAKELADVIIYADLLAKAADINLGEAVIDKFNEVSIKRGAQARL